MSSDLRRRQLAKIHCQKRDLGLDDDAYRLMLRAVANVDSASELDGDGRGRLIEHMAKLLGGDAPYPGKPKNMEQRRELEKIEAFLAEAKLPWGYAHAIARRMYQVDRVDWCTSEQLRSVIAALYKRAKRHGLRTE